MFFNRLTLACLALPLLLNSCGFFRDNQERTLRAKFDEAAKAEECDSLADFSERLKNSSHLHLKTNIDCHLKSIQDSLANVKGEKPEELSQTELKALLNAFYFEEELLQEEEMEGLLALKNLVNPGNPEGFHYDEISIFAQFVKDNLGRMRSLSKEHDWEKQLVIALEIFAQRPYQEEALSEEAFYGWVLLAKRFLSEESKPAQSNLTRINAEFAFSSLKTLLGFSKQPQIPFRLFNGSGELRRNLEDFIDWSDKNNTLMAQYLDTTPPLELNAKLRSEFDSISASLISSIINMTGFAQSGAIHRNDFEDLIEMLNTLTLYDTEMNERRFDLDPELIGRMVFETKHNFVGYGNASIAKESLKRVGEHIFELMYHSDTAALVAESDLQTQRIYQIVKQPELLNSMQENWKDYLVQSRWYQPSKKVSLLEASERFYLRALITAFLKSYDDNQSGSLDISNDSKKDEFKDLVSSIAKAYSGLKSFFEDKKKNEKNGEAVSEKIDSIVEDPKSFYALTTYADNLGKHANSDGAVNGSEFTDLIELIHTYTQDKDSISFATEESQKPLRFFSAYETLFAYSPFLYSFSFLETKLELVTTQADQFPALPQALKALHESNDGAEFVEKIELAYNRNLEAEERARIIEAYPDYRKIKISTSALYPATWNFETDKFKVSSVVTYMSLSRMAKDIYDFHYPYYLKVPVEAIGYDLPPDSEDLGKLRFAQVEEYFRGRLRGHSFTWLPPKLRIALLAAPENSGAELMSQLIWRSPEILSALQKYKEGESVDFLKIIQEAYKDRGPSKEEINPYELIQRIEALTAIFSMI